MGKENSNLAALPAYDDLWIRIVLSLLGAHFIVVYGDSEDISKIIRNFNYYNALVSSFVISFLVLYVIWLITRFLDKKLNWLLHPIKRVATQFVLGVVLPAGFAILLAWIYFRMYGYNISETPYFDSDLPVIVLLLVLANVYYFVYFIVTVTWPGNTSKIQDRINSGKEGKQGQQVYKSVLLIQTALKSFPLKVEEIAYFFREDKQNYLRTITGEVHAISYSLDQLESMLDPAVFFRINRQMIVAFASCKDIMPYENQRLELTLHYPFSGQIIVSETKVAAFKQWLNR